MKKLFVIAIAALLSSCDQTNGVRNAKVNPIHSTVVRVVEIENGDYYSEGDTIVHGDALNNPDTLIIRHVYEP